MSFNFYKVLNVSLFICAHILVFISSSVVHAQNADLDDLTLEELLNVKTTVATKKATTARETPGIVSVITSEDIRNMGARDLIDILRTVPGFHFGYDVQGVVSVGIRGLWASEGKHLLIIDGIEMNELLYAGNQYGNEFPVDQIQRIEIIRGPGSAIYGGFAELAVINVTTKSGKELNGSTAQVTLGQWENTTARTNLSASTGREIENGNYSFGFYTGRARRGDGDYYGSGEAAGDGNTYTAKMDFEDADEIQPMVMNLGYHQGDFKFRFLYNKYVVDSYTMFGMTPYLGQKGMADTFESYNLTTSYDVKLSGHTKLTSQLQWNQQRPWNQKSGEAIFTFNKFDVVTTRVRPSLTLTSEMTEKLNLLGGVEHVQDSHKIDSYMAWDTPGDLQPQTFSNGKNEYEMNSTAIFAQAVYDSKSFDTTIGARYENPSETKGSFVPRVAFTKAEKNWHGKFLYSEAFRSPVVYNIEYKQAAEILPEEARTYEIEFGRKLTSTSYLTANLFSTMIKNPIVYMVSGSEEYANFDNLGTDGLELDYRWKPTWGQMQLAYAYYQVSKSDVSDYEAAGAGRDKRLLAMPQHSVILNTTYHMAHIGWKLNPQVLYFGEKSGYDFDGTQMSIKDYGPTWLLNLYVGKENVFFKGLGAGVGLFNILNEKDYFIQPYNAGHSPVPAPSTELVARIDYSTSF